MYLLCSGAAGDDVADVGFGISIGIQSDVVALNTDTTEVIPDSINSTDC